MNQNEEVSIVKLVGDAREAVIEQLAALLSDAPSALEMPETLAVMQSIPPQLVEEVALPIIRDVAMQRGVDLDQLSDADYLPEQSQGIGALFKLDKVIAVNISTATNIILQQLQQQAQHRAQASQRLSQGILAAN